MRAALLSSLNADQLAIYTARQLNHFFPDPEPAQPEKLLPAVEWTLDRLYKLHRSTADKYYFQNGQPYFDHLHGDQYATYIYFLSRYCVTELGSRNLAAKLYLLNKALFAVDIYFEVELPEIFLLCHPVGTVLGRASYQDYLVVSQSCTVGGVGDTYPTLGFGVVLCADVSVVGGCKLGDDSCIGAGSLLVSFDVPAGHTAVGRANDVRILPGGRPKWKDYYDPTIAPR